MTKPKPISLSCSLHSMIEFGGLASNALVRTMHCKRQRVHGEKGAILLALRGSRDFFLTCNATSGIGPKERSSLKPYLCAGAATRTAGPITGAAFTHPEFLDRALILRLRVVPCLAGMTQQIHSLCASGVRSFQAAFVVASEPTALHKSAGVLCTGPGLLSFFIN